MTATTDEVYVPGPYKGMTYDQWCAALVTHARSLQEPDEHPITSMADLGGKDSDSWIAYWEGGHSPEEALREDCSYG